MEWLLGLPFSIVAFVLMSAFGRAARQKRVDAAYHFDPPNSHGKAKFADNDDLKNAGLLKKRGIPIGYSPDGKYALHYGGSGHILTVAAARTGKGASLLVNALISWPNSVMVIDPKGEMAAVTGHYRRRFGNVYVLNPFNILPDALKGLNQARFNPMDLIDPSSIAFHAGCDKLAGALVWDEGKENSHFTISARIMTSGVIAAVARHGAPHEKNLPAIARIISGDIRGFCRLTIQSTKDPFIIQKLGRFAFAAPDNKEVNDVIATAITQLAFIGNAAIAESLSGSDFRFSDLKLQPGTTIYVCLPLYYLELCDKYYRLKSECFLWALLSVSQSVAGKPVLAIIDEMAQLGPHMKSLENAMGMAAGAAGLQLWCVLQDLSQLKGMFPDTWETFIQNCGVTTWFGARDQTTREYVSKLAGTCEVLSHSRSVSIDLRTGEPVVGDSASQFGRALLLPHEVGQIAPDEMIAFVEGVRCGPIKAKRKFYFRVFSKNKYRPNPYVRKNVGLFAWLFSWLIG